jgi:DNA mismatch repair protein MutS2
VKAEYKSRVRGFVHDRSQSGATFFIEPEYVLELNNELMALIIDEREEIERILKELSARVGNLADQLLVDMDILAEMESYLVRAEYAYGKKAVMPEVNNRGYINIFKGRHPLIDKDKVVPVSLELGKDYDFLLISGANTGGKTVTLKMSGLFCLMAACGLFIPAAEGSQVAIFDDVFCDIGDSQSIEESLSTFSSHVTNVAEICEKVSKNSLVLLDELGGGTNPDEGQALAKAVMEYLLKVGCKGIVTTHFTPLKEFAYTVPRIENASMEFDSTTLKPLYRIKIGLPGASNALAISKRFGLKQSILDSAYGYLSEGSRNFENIVRMAEDSRVEAQETLAKAQATERELQGKLAEVNKKIEALDKEREKLLANAKAESRRIIGERTQQANDMLDEIEDIFKQAEISEKDLIKARTLKNRLGDIAFVQDEKKGKVTDYQTASATTLKEGMLVFVKPMQSEGKVVSFNPKKNEAEVLVGSLRMHLPLKDLQIIGMEQKTQPKTKLKVLPSATPKAPQLELNVLGLTVDELPTT